jgi:uncharacterized protein
MIRNATPTDFPSILALNAESVHFLSAMDAARLALLHANAAHHRVVEQHGRVQAFLLAFREGADYDSVNYRWFASRYPQFLYIDRVVVSAAQQGHGLGAALYDDVFMLARQAGLTLIAAEFDVEPRNQVSERFHARYGFEEMGSQWVAGGSKKVSMQIARVP